MEGSTLEFISSVPAAIQLYEINILLYAEKEKTIFKIFELGRKAKSLVDTDLEGDEYRGQITITQCMQRN